MNDRNDALDPAGLFLSIAVSDLGDGNTEVRVVAADRVIRKADPLLAIPHLTIALSDANPIRTVYASGLLGHISRESGLTIKPLLMQPLPPRVLAMVTFALAEHDLDAEMSAYQMRNLTSAFLPAFEAVRDDGHKVVGPWADFIVSIFQDDDDDDD